jgi:hypothetical protein
VATIEIRDEPAPKAETGKQLVATLKDHPEITGSGRNDDEAIGNLIKTNADRLGIKIVKG